jgi:trk system potassium uptake protein TrkA
MRIMICGAGEVGFLVASELYEEHDVTVIDKDPAACSRMKDIDVRVMQGNAANARFLVESGVKKADIVLAVTGNDEVNIITCIIASHVGVRQTIARVSNPEYIDRPVQDRKEVGISHMICPELVMAEELARALYFPSMLMNRELAEGKVELIELKVAENMPFQGKLEEIPLPESCKIMAINRAGEIAILDSQDAIVSKDHIILLCDSKALPDLGQLLAEKEKSSHKAMIVGGGMVGFYLAGRLEKMGFDIKLIELSQERCREIADKLKSTIILNGDGTDITLLKEEGAEEMDVVFAVTGLDEKNLLCSLLVKQLGAKKIFSRVNRSYYIKLFEMVGVDRALSPGQVTADAVLERVIGGEEVITLSDERIELVDFLAKHGAKIIGKNLSRELPKGAVAGMVVRSSKPAVPKDDFKVLEGDRVFIMAMPEVMSKVKKLFFV